MRLYLLALSLAVLVLGSPAQAEEARLLEDIDEVVEEYIEANGGIESIKEVRSLRLVGRVEEADKVYEVVLIKKRPDLKRILLKHQGRILHMGYDGEHAWHKFVTPQGTTYRLLEGAERTEFIEDSDFDGPLIGHEAKGNKLSLLGTEQLDRRLVYKVQVEKPDGQKALVYIDVVTFQELRNVSIETEGDEVSQTVSKFQDYEKRGGIWMARRIIRSRNGKVISDMKVETIDLNAGVFDSYFSPPEEALAESAAEGQSG